MGVNTDGGGSLQLLTEIALAWLVLHLFIKEMGEEREDEGEKEEKEKIPFKNSEIDKFKDTETLRRKGEDGIWFKCY